MSAQVYQAPQSIGRLQQRALIVGVLGVIASIAGAVISPAQFYHSYLIGFLLVLGLCLGSLGMLMLQHLTSGHWGIIIRRPLESATRTLPLMVLLFIPLALGGGMKFLYGEWLHPEEPLSQMQQHYLTVGGYRLRAVAYFAVWLFLVWIFNRWSKQQDVRTGDRALRRKFKLLAGPGIILYVFGMSFAAIDWVMSISPHWASTIYGFIFVAGQMISAMALIIAIVVLLAKTAPMAGLIQDRHLHDLGKLLFMWILVWAYFDFSQLLIIWAGNLPEEISYYTSRLQGGWNTVAILVLIFHFFVPFLILLSRDVKRSQKWLPAVAVWLIFMRLVDLFWTTRPDFSKNVVSMSWLDIAVPVAMIGLWLGYFAYNLKQAPLLPLGDPKLAEAIGSHEH